MGANVNSVLHGDDGYFGSYEDSKQAPGLDLRYGGQFGRLPAFAGVDALGRFEEWQSAKPYVKRNVIVKLLDYPKAFDYLPNRDLLVGTLQALLERHVQSLDGLNSSLSVNFSEIPMGTSQEVFQDVVNVTKERSNISLTFQEKDGAMVRRYLEFIIQYLYMDPILKYPRITFFLPDEFSESQLYLPEMKTFSFMAIEPDLLHRYAVNAWLCFNCMFDKGGDNIGQKNQSNEGSFQEHSIGLSSITLNDEIIRAQANDFLKEMSIYNMSYTESVISPIPEVNPEIAKSAQSWEQYTDIGIKA